MTQKLNVTEKLQKLETDNLVLKSIGKRKPKLFIKANESKCNKNYGTCQRVQKKVYFNIGLH